MKCPCDDAPLVRIKNASLFIPGDAKRKIVLQNISLDIDSHLAIFGPNGSGKSTLLKFINGDLWQKEGSICWKVQGKCETSHISAHSICRLLSPHVLQFNRQAFAWFSVRDFLASPLPAAGDKAGIDLLLQLDGASMLNNFMGFLSQGELRLVLFVQALASRPKLLLLDEWFDGLDIRHKTMINAKLASLRKQIVFVFASHRPTDLPEWVKQRIWLENGSLKPAPPHLQKPCFQASSALEDRTRTIANDRPVFDLKNVNVYANRKLVLNNIDWRVMAGENWRLTGANGSGKSTLLRLLAGDEFAAAGGACRRMSCKTGAPLALLEQIRQKIVLISDLSQELYGYDLTGLELVCSGYDNSIGVYRDFSSAEIKGAREIIAALFPDSDNPENISIRRLSTGQLRRLFLARAMMSEPEALLLDEPCSGLDSISRNAYLDFLQRLTTTGINGMRAQIIMVSHNEDDFPQSITRHAHMEAGRLIVMA